MSNDTRKPGWYFLAWKLDSMRDTQAVVGPFPSREESVAEKVKAARDGYACGEPYFVGPKLHAETEAA